MGSIEKEHTQGFLCASLLDPTQPELIDESMAKPIQLDEQEYQSLCKLINDKNEQFVLPCQVLSVQTMSIRGVSYSTLDSRDCNIMFHPSDHPATIQFQKAGVIQTIFQHSSTRHTKGLYLTVRELTPISSDGHDDPYRKYGFAAGFLCDGGASIVQLRVIAASQVVSHFASTEMRGTANNRLIHVLPTNRVRNDVSFSIHTNIQLFQLVMLFHQDFNVF
jgi:hypothetical protein